MTDAEPTAVSVVEASPRDVASLLRARTKDDAGRELGEWTDDTRPTYEQVEDQIEIARALVRLDSGEPVPSKCLEGRETTVALLAAMLVEQSYYPEQVQAGNLSAYAQLAALYAQAREGMMACVGGGDVGGGVLELDISGIRPFEWPIDWWQRNLSEPPSQWPRQ